MIDVWLLYGGGWEPPAKPPGRRLLAAGSATLAELAHAIDLAFARWDHAHLHCFELGDGSRYILGGHDELDPPAADSQTIALQRPDSPGSASSSPTRSTSATTGPTNARS